MQNRTKDIVSLVEAADLELVRHYREASRTCAEVRAQNGNRHTFSISCNGKSDVRGDQIALQKMRRFARENAVKPSVEQAVTAPLPKKEAPKAPTRTVITMKPRSPTATFIEQAVPAAEVVSAKPAPVSEAAQDLMPKEFYRLCEWIKGVRMAQFPSLEALALHARTSTELPVTEGAASEAMEAVEIALPDHWLAPLDPHVVLARELATLMKSLGNEPSRDFTRFLSSLPA